MVKKIRAVHSCSSIGTRNFIISAQAQCTKQLSNRERVKGSDLAKKRFPFNYREPPINPVTPMRIEANIMV